MKMVYYWFTMVLLVKINWSIKDDDDDVDLFGSDDDNEEVDAEKARIT